MIFGPQYSHPMQRVQPTDGDRQEEDARDGKKKKVQYQGRAWEETEEELPFQPHTPEKNPAKSERTGVYADRALLERAQALFQKLTTLDEKAAQLFFLVTDAIYDTDLQRDVELLIQAWQIGGILFHKGEYRRQAYLIEHYQQLSKTALLFANDFKHGLSFYLQGDPFPNSPSQQHYNDLGKAVTVQNRRLGVQIQFDRERGEAGLPMTEEEAKAFRLGIRNAHGIVGKEKIALPESSPTKSGINILSFQEGAFQNGQVQETINFKTFTFFDATSTPSENLEKELLTAFKQLYDVFLCSTNISDAISTLVSLVDSGKLSDAALDRHVMKALIIKSYFFK